MNNQFNNILVDIIQLFRENTDKNIRKLFSTYYKQNENKFKDINFISKLISTFSKHSDIIKQDESIFSNDYNKDPLYLLNDTNLDFKVIWKSYTGDKIIFWNKLHLLYYLGLYILKSYDQYKLLCEKQKDIFDKLKQSLLTKEKVEYEMKKQELEEKETSSIDYDDLKKKLGDGIITDIVIDLIKEITSSGLNLENLTSLDDNLMKDIYSKIQNKIEYILKSKNMTYADLVEEAKQYKNKFINFAKSSGIKIFSDLADKINDIIDNMSKKAQHNEGHHNEGHEAHEGVHNEGHEAHHNEGHEAHHNEAPMFDMQEQIAQLKNLFDSLPAGFDFPFL